MPLDRRSVLAGGLATLGVVAAGAVDAAPAELSFDGLYKSFGVRGLEFSDVVQSLKGREVAMVGYIAPPLKADSAFFVLTREPMALCPFCQSDADWPVDIVVVYLKSAARLAPAGARTRVTGRLAVGPHVDPDTGFVSQIRIETADVQPG